MLTAVLLQGDDLLETNCGQCHKPAEEWSRNPSYHPLSRPGAMGDGDIYCSDCADYSYSAATNRLVHTYCGLRHKAKECAIS